MNRAGLAVGLLTLAMFIAGCNATGVRRNGIPAGAQTALDTAIQDIDAGRYDKLYQEASDEWRGQSSMEQSRATLQGIRDKLGSVRTRNEQQAGREEQTSTGPVAGHSVTVYCHTTFERAEAMETFTLVERDGQWKLAKYYVSSSGVK